MSKLSRYVVGFPLVVGSGQFFEAFPEYGCRVFVDSSFGLFARYNGTQGNFDSDPHISTAGVSSGRSLLNRETFSIGASLNFNLGMPFI